MTPELFNRIAITPAMSMLPVGMDSPSARAMILAICLQESGLKYRRQIGGPARSYAQFEMGGGIKGVLNHPATKFHILNVLDQLNYSHELADSYNAIEHNDILCVVYTRLLLFTLPSKLPESDNPTEGWKQYISAWRPGKPHPESWNRCFAEAWKVINSYNNEV